MEFAEAIDTIAKTLREDSETRDAWKNATAGVLCDHQTDTPEQREAAAKAVLSLLFFGAEPLRRPPPRLPRGQASPTT